MSGASYAIAGGVGVLVVAGAAIAYAGADASIVGASSAAVLLGLAVMIAVGTRSHGGGARRDTRWTALLQSGGPARDTLAAVDRLTDPMAVERTITTAMREVAGVARLELLRAPAASPESLRSARAASPALVQAAIASGVVRRGDRIGPDVAQALDEIPADVVVAVRHESRVHALLAIEGRVRQGALLQLSRFADLLAAKLELHRLYAELAHREQLAALGGLVAALAHDLRTPLSSITLSMQMLERRREQLEDDAELVDIAADETRRLEGYVAELLELSKPVRIEPRSLELASIVEAALRRGRSSAESCGVALRGELSGGVAAVAGEALRLERVVDNLLSNAIAVAPRGSDVTVALRASGDDVVLEVADRGPGIPPEEHERIFEPFVSRRPGGTGLGLAIARRIVVAHGGRIEVESALGRGTRMRVRLPAYRAG